MNVMNRHVVMAMEAAANEIISGEISPDAAPHNIVDIDPPTELERHANLHRRIIDQQEGKAEDALALGQLHAAFHKEKRKRLRETYQADLAELKQNEADSKASTLAAIHTAERLIAGSKAWLQEIDAA